MGSRKDRERQFRRQLLADTAMSLFREHSYEAITMQDIATAAQCGKATLYQHFANKEEILITIITAAQRESLHLLESSCHESQPVLNQLQTYIELQYQYYLNYGSLIISLMRRNLEGNLNPEQLREVLENRIRRSNLLTAILQRGIDQQILVGTDSHKLARMLHNSIRGFSLEILEGEPLDRDPQKDIEIISQVFFKGVLKAGGDN